MAERIAEHETGEMHDYGRKQGVEFRLHAVPETAPEWARNVEQFWNAVHTVENRKNSTLALDYVGAFPHQLSAQQREWLLKDFIREEFTRKGFGASAAIHAP